MRYTWLDAYLLRKRGVTKDLQPDWNWVRYHVGGRMFAAVCLNKENVPYYITLKLEPLEGELLRGQYTDIVPGYYCDKTHWNSVRPDGQVPDELLQRMLDQSYRLVLAGSAASASGDPGAERLRGGLLRLRRLSPAVSRLQRLPGQGVPRAQGQGLSPVCLPCEQAPSGQLRRLPGASLRPVARHPGPSPFRRRFPGVHSGAR